MTDSTVIATNLVKAYKLFLTTPDSSIVISKRSLAQALEQELPYLEGYSYFVLSKAYWAKANYRLSTEYGFKALKAYENTTHVFHWGESYLSLARTFVDLKNYDQARAYLKRAHLLTIKGDQPHLLADVYREESMLQTETGAYDSALISADKGIHLYEAFKDSLNLSILLSRKSKVFFLLKRYNESAFYNRAAVVLDKLVDNRRGLGICYLQAAQNAFHTHQADSALFFLDKSIPLNRALDNFGTLIKVHELKATIFTFKKEPLLAVEQYKLVSQYKDSLYNTEKAGQIQEMQSLYELELKNKTIAALGEENAQQESLVHNQRLLTFVMGAGIVLLAALIIVLFRLRNIQSRANSELQEKNRAIALQKEEIQAQAEFLQHLNDLKSKLFSVISHDLRGPIASLQALLELLTSKKLTPDEFVLFSDKLKTNLGVTQRTLENLLSWSMSQMEGIKTDLKDVDVKTTVEDSRRLLDEQASRKNITIDNQITDSIHVRVDQDQFQLILRNLMHNAIKFSKANQKVVVRAVKDERFCHLKVIDAGIGMNQDEINLITGSEYFTKVGTQQEKGTGLGLLLCKEFVKRNGGQLSIHSEEGEGTEVTISIPLM
ncbi:sensor histidine kinase [Pseudochryseolinea flava]|uniref:sensor histidine kinase n=1 Tax=Pseudochryseolinea flava TaxID=2059302 RepID=UPI001403E4D2|nr:HAMP domain-containing sensor histidine kinase [Pseudochryseolinea flava]